jgi:hypothetical protein
MCLQEETRSASLACRHSSSILEATSFSDVFFKEYIAFAIARFKDSQ